MRFLGRHGEEEDREVEAANEGGVGLTLLEAAAVCDLAALEAALGRGEDIGISDAEGR